MTPRGKQKLLRLKAFRQERVMGLEPTTTSLATRYSTTELHPQSALCSTISRLAQSRFQEEIIGAGISGQGAEPGKRELDSPLCGGIGEPAPVGDVDDPERLLNPVNNIPPRTEHDRLIPRELVPLGGRQPLGEPEWVSTCARVRRRVSGRGWLA